LKIFKHAQGGGRFFVDTV